MECKRYLGLTVHSEEENVLIPPHIQFIHKQKVSERYILKLLSGFFVFIILLQLFQLLRSALNSYI